MGLKRTQTIALEVPVYGRNNMSWDDDRRAAVFVSSKDPAAMQFAKYTASIVRDNLRIDVPVNIQYALGIFQTLNEFGINYVVDPSSAFEDNVGTSSIDFLQFPYQTLMYRGGDCDDLSILVCSLFEAVGIRTAFITVPGHIFMAFDAGITPELAKSTFRNISEYIIVDDEVWVPLEITLSDEGFYRACRYGAREWNNANANGTAALYKMSDSWKIYQPISVPGASVYFNMPDSKDIQLAFNTEIDQWSRGELKTLTGTQPVFVVMKEEEKQEEVVLKGRPLSTKTLNDIISIADSAVAVVPPASRKKDSDEEEDKTSGGNGGSGGNNDGDDSGFDEFEESELLEDLIPLDFAIATATLQTDVSVKPGEEFLLNGDSDLLANSEQTSASGLAMAEEDTKDDTSFLDDYFDMLEEQAAQLAKAAEPAEETDKAAAESAEKEAAYLAASESEKINAPVEAEASSHSGKTKAIIIVSTITAAAALAAGIIIFGKKKKREGEV